MRSTKIGPTGRSPHPADAEHAILGGPMLKIDPGVKEELLERIEKRSHEKSPKGGVVKVKSRVIHHFQMKAEADGFAFISDGGGTVGGTEPGRRRCAIFWREC